MKKLSVLAGAALLASCFATGAMAAPTTINFGLSGGLNGNDVGQTKVYGGLITVSAFYVTKTDWSNGGGITYLSNNTQLFERQNTPNDIGVGICNAGDRIIGCVGNGDTNEIDNNGTYIDVMMITLAPGWDFVDMSLSSLDYQSAINDDGFRLFAHDGAMPDLTGLAAMLAGNEISMGSITPTFSLASVSGYHTLYLTGSANLNYDDYLLTSITVDTSGPGGEEVPEPASLALLGAGLLGLGMAQRRRTKKA